MAGGILKKIQSLKGGLKKHGSKLSQPADEEKEPELIKPRRSSFINQEIDDFKLQKTQERNI
jgi:hypothetical protein